MVDKLILKIGHFGGNVQFVFPEGGLQDLTKYGIQFALKATGGGLVGTAMNASQLMAKKLLGGVPFPGTLYVYSDRIEFKPAFRMIGAIYQGVEEISIPTFHIKSVEALNKAVIFNYTEINLTSGHSVRIVSAFNTSKIVNAIKSVI